MKDPLKLVASIVGCELVGIISTPLTLTAISTWYVTLHKPVFSPPNWVFGPVWTLLYFLMGMSFYLIWIQDWKKKKVRTAGRYFLVQLAFNFAWSPIFFGFRSPLLGFVTILGMWLLIIVSMIKFYALSKPAFYLLVPYLLWVSFASVLNAAILILN